MSFIRHPKDFYAGALFIAFGAAAIAVGSSYTLGSAARMGPGYFPRVLGLLLLGFGGLLSLTGLRATGEPPPRWRWRPLAIVLASVALFCLGAQWLGLIVAGTALVFVASIASRDFRWKEALVSGAIQGVFAVALFVYGLGMPLPIWPVFITGTP
jgi:hypothetical protein